MQYYKPFIIKNFKVILIELNPFINVLTAAH
ncbi:hypothetical protein GGR22_001120 [Flavobacterium gossypii]|uniref:Uncharacterized protein n=2 Tax=Flavobacterium TaxID=237 RepID=A0A495MJ40_9FLAO|nr:hypothetical protein [Flavobacterium gossypii]RKS26006.1 hypothetical protein CLV94_1057 [Flavobacterium endophyticum]